MHRADQGDLIDTFGHMRKERAHLRAALAVWGKLPLRPLEEDVLVARPVFNFGMIGLDLLAVIPSERGLGVKRVDMRHAPSHKQKDDPLGLGGKVRRLHRQWIDRGRRLAFKQLAEDAGHQQ